MQQIAFYLQKFNNIALEAVLVRDLAVSILRDRFHLPIEKDQVAVKKDTVYLTVHPAIKSEVFMRRKEFVDLLESELGKLKIKDVR